MKLPEKITLEKIIERTKKDGECLVWTGPQNGLGYGRVGWSESGKSVKCQAHRAMWYLINGDPDPPLIGHIMSGRAWAHVQYDLP